MDDRTDRRSAAGGMGRQSIQHPGPGSVCWTVRRPRRPGGLLPTDRPGTPPEGGPTEPHFPFGRRDRRAGHTRAGKEGPVRAPLEVVGSGQKRTMLREQLKDAGHQQAREPLTSLPSPSGASSAAGPSLALHLPVAHGHHLVLAVVQRLDGLPPSGRPVTLSGIEGHDSVVGHIPSWNSISCRPPRQLGQGL